MAGRRGRAGGGRHACLTRQPRNSQREAYQRVVPAFQRRGAGELSCGDTVSLAEPMRRTISAALLALAAAGCYRYGPVQVGEIEPGASVRMRLSGNAVDRLRNGAAADGDLLDGFSMTGRVTRAGPDTIVMEVPTMVMEANVRPRTVYQGISLARSEVQAAELRRIDRRRTTWVVAGIGSAIAASVVVALRGNERTGGNLPPGGGPPEIRFPLGFRFQFP
jgi:hypothetical protein